MAKECYRIGEVVLNSGTQEVSRAGVIIPLPPLSFSLLLTLARHAPNVVTTRQLEEEVWEGLVVDRGTINKRVLLVRNALREAGCGEEYISVVRGTGYRLAAPVERLEKENEAVQALASRTRARRIRNSVPTWGSMVLVLLAAMASVSLRDYREVQGAVADGADIAAVRARSHDGRVNGHTHPPTLAVLPFEDLSEGMEDSYLGEGIAEEIISILSGFEELSVAASASSFTFRDPGEPVASVASQLGVDSVLKGSILRVGERIQVTAQLVDAYSDAPLWTGNYERPLAQVMEVQEDISLNAARGLRVTVSNYTRPDRTGRTGDVQAFTYYLKGRALHDQRLRHGAAGLREALDYYRRAAEEDPQFVRAHVGMASTYFLLPAYDESLDATSFHELAETSARNALQLDPMHAGALGVLAAILAQRGEAGRAAALFRQSQDLGNTDSNIIHWQARLLTSMGYFSEQLGPLREAHRLDPLNLYLGSSLSIALTLGGEPHEAAEMLEGMEPIATRNYILAVTNLYLGRFDEARSLMRGLEVATGVLPEPYADLVVDAVQDPELQPRSEAAILEAVLAGRLSPQVAFESLLIMGSPRVFDLEVDLEGTALHQRLPETAWLNWGVDLRRDPRFKSWVRELGYDRYWSRNGWPDRCKPTGLDDFECI